MRAAAFGLALALIASGAGAREYKGPREISGVVVDAGPRAPRSWGPDLVAIAESHLGQGNPTGKRGPWCADFISMVLRRAGRPPLASRMASAALAYGPLEIHPHRGDLVVLGGGRHVGIVVADLGDRVEMVSGNWGHAVRLAIVGKRGARFVRINA